MLSIHSESLLCMFMVICTPTDISVLNSVHLFKSEFAFVSDSLVIFAAKYDKIRFLELYCGVPVVFINIHIITFCFFNGLFSQEFTMFPSFAPICHFSGCEIKSTLLKHFKMIDSVYFTLTIDSNISKPI